MILSRIKERNLRKEVERRKGEVVALSKDMAQRSERSGLPSDPELRLEMESRAAKVRAERKALLQVLKRRKRHEQGYVVL